ncbi:MAG: DNA recombination protein RmuC [Clostridia bacterium]
MDIIFLLVISGLFVLQAIILYLLFSSRLAELNLTLKEKQSSQQQAFDGYFQASEARFSSFAMSNEQRLENIQGTVEKKLQYLQEDSSKKLEEIRKMVDENLQEALETRMTKSFQLVNERLEQVYKGLGEMQSLAVGVGDLKKVLSNVKTRGILGEIQLGAILSEILAPEQYACNVATKPGSKNLVEYAIKLPGSVDQPVYLPIDAKFPLDAYQNLLDAREKGNVDEVKLMATTLQLRMKGFAKDIHDKYIHVPHTCDFAILFLPFEGLYAEAVNLGLVETLQREYKVSIAGPSTMAALLNSLQMGFRTLAIEKRSSEVWQLLGAVRTEFEKFGSILIGTQQRLEQANKELDKLIGVRTRSILSKLRGVERLGEEEAEELIL